MITDIYDKGDVRPLGPRSLVNCGMDSQDQLWDWTMFFSQCSCTRATSGVHGQRRVTDTCFCPKVRFTRCCPVLSFLAKITSADYVLAQFSCTRATSGYRYTFCPKFRFTHCCPALSFLAMIVKAIDEALLPTTKMELQSLLGKINFIRRFISNLSERVLPFSPLLKLKNDQEFRWGDVQQEAFEE